MRFVTLPAGCGEDTLMLSADKCLRACGKTNCDRMHVLVHVGNPSKVVVKGCLGTIDSTIPNLKLNCL